MEQGTPPHVRSKALPVALGFASLVLVACSFFLRTHYVRDTVILNEEVRFGGVDSWYHVRLIENLVHHFPQRSTVDPYGLHPGGQAVPVAPLFDWLIAGVIAMTFGSEPDPRTLELVCAYAPPALGAACVLPIYLLGRLLLNRTAGLLAALLLVISPGHFLSRSLLGYTDHHVLEVLLALCVILLLSRALRAAGAGEPFTRARLIARGIVPGAALGLYLLTWTGGSLLVGIIALATVAHSILAHWRRESVEATVTVNGVALGVALLLVWPFGTSIPGFGYHRAALAAGIGLCALAGVLAQSASRWRWPRAAYAPALLGIAASVTAGVAGLFPGWSAAVGEQLARLFGLGAAPMIVEAVPLLSSRGEWSFDLAWSQFTTGAVLCVPGLILLIVRAVRSAEAPVVLVVVWSVVILAATLGQNRFAYYAAANVALLTAYLAAGVIGWVDQRTQPVAGESTVRPDNRLRGPLFLVSNVVVLFVLVYPNLGPAMRTARRIAVPHPDWPAALRWLKESTPEPFGSADAYYQRFDTTAEAGRLRADYGIMNAWQFGYWVTRIAHRVPVANPGQRGAETAARFYLAEDPQDAKTMLADLDCPYLLVESTLPYLPDNTGRVLGMISSLCDAAGIPRSRFSETVYRRDEEGRLQPLRLYYPEYFQTMLARTYVFRRLAYQPEHVSVFELTERRNAQGEVFQEVTRASGFPNYETASRFVAGHTGSTVRIASLDPTQSCIPLNPLAGWSLLYQSPTTRCVLQGERVAHVEVYGVDLDRGAPD